MMHSHQITGSFRPLQDWVILAPEELVTEKGGIVLPDATERMKEYRRARVVAVGPGYQVCNGGVYKSALIATELKVGQFVFIQRFVDGELSFTLNGEKCFACRERHLSLVIA